VPFREAVRIAISFGPPRGGSSAAYVRQSEGYRMMTLSSLFDLERQPLVDARTELIRGVLDGFRSRPRSLKP
jgi:hypothetical protein